jgi:hypothetical protein
MKRLDEKFGRSTRKSVLFGGEEVVEDDVKSDLSDVVKITAPIERKESLFSSGAPTNNATRRGRPTTEKTAPEQVDGTLLLTPIEKEEGKVQRYGVRPSQFPLSRLVNFPEEPNRLYNERFEDDAWAIKQQSSATQPPQKVKYPVQVGPPPGSDIHELASITRQTVTQTLSAQLTASPIVSRPSSIPPTQTAPHSQPLQLIAQEFHPNSQITDQLLPKQPVLRASTNS